MWGGVLGPVRSPRSRTDTRRSVSLDVPPTDRPPRDRYRSGPKVECRLRRGWSPTPSLRGSTPPRGGLFSDRPPHGDSSRTGRRGSDEPQDSLRARSGDVWG